MAEWHAFAKFQLHTKSTLQHLKQLTTELGKFTWKFRDTMQSAFATFELPKKQRPKRGNKILVRGKRKQWQVTHLGRNPNF